MKCIHISILVLSAILLLQLFLIVLFVTLQVVINPRNHPQEFSVIAGGGSDEWSKRRDNCQKIERIPAMNIMTDVNSNLNLPIYS